jgi:hypothetical protein
VVVTCSGNMLSTGLTTETERLGNNIFRWLLGNIDSSMPVIQPSLNLSHSLGVSVSLLNDRPAPKLNGKDSRGNILEDRFVFLDLEEIQEVTPSGSIVKSTTIPDGFTLTTGTEGNIDTFLYSKNLSVGNQWVELQFEFSISSEARTVHWANYPVDLSPNVMKWLMRLSSYPFTSPANHLSFAFRLQAYPALTGMIEGESPMVEIQDYALNSARNEIRTYLTALTFALCDSAQVKVNISLAPNLKDYTISFPSYDYTLEYDPSIALDVSSIGSGSSGSGSDGTSGSSGGSGGTNVNEETSSTGSHHLVAILVPIFVVLGVLIFSAGLAVAIVLGIKNKEKINKLRKRIFGKPEVVGAPEQQIAL